MAQEYLTRISPQPASFGIVSGLFKPILPLDSLLRQVFTVRGVDRIFDSSAFTQRFCTSPCTGVSHTRVLLFAFISRVAHF